MAQLLIFGAGRLSLLAGQTARDLGIRTILYSTPAQAVPWQAAAAELDLPLITAAHPDELTFDIAPPTLALSIGAPWFFKRSFLENTLKDCTRLNLHGTTLPRSRGGNLFSWQILSGKRSGICLLQHLCVELDAGEIVDYEEFIYPAFCRKPIDYLAVYEEKNAAFLARFFRKWLMQHTLPQAAVQADYLSTYWPRLRADLHGWINWHWPAQEIERFVCAFDEPYGGARCRWREKEVVIRDVWAQSEDGHTHPFQWGIVTRNNGQWLTVAVQGGELLICSVCDTRGDNLLHEIRPGDRLYHIAADLENAQVRLEKTSDGLKIQAPKP